MSAGRIGLAALIACMGLTMTAGVSDAFATYGKVSIKKVNVGGPAADSFGFQPSAHLGGGFSLKGGQRWSKIVVANGGGYHTSKSYTVTEPASGDYELTSLACDRWTSSGWKADTDSTASLAERKATIRVSPNEWVECTFTNTRKKVTPGVEVTKTGPSHAYVGDTVSFGFDVENTGNDPLRYVSLSDDRCADVVGPVSKHDDDGDDVLDPGETWKYTCSYEVPAHAIGDANPVVNTATVTAKDTGHKVVRDDDKHATTILHPAIDIEKTGPAKAAAGTSVGYALEVTNPGDVPFAEGRVAVTDERCEAAPALTSTNGDATSATLDPGDRWTYACSVKTVAGERVVVNVAQVKATTEHDRSVTDEDTFTTELLNPVPMPPMPPDPPVHPVTPVPPAPVATPPAQQVAGVTRTARVRRGSAKLRGPRSCPTTRRVKATVTGRRIARVTFFVDGRRVRTVKKADEKGRWVLSIRRSSLRPGAHRVKARVQFTSASRTRTRNLRTTITRCAARSVSPRFTG